MRMMAFASRNVKEILRDKINLFFGIGFPVILLLLFSAIQANVPVEIFAIDSITPGLAVFGLSFISLYSGVLIAKDRSSSLLLRLLASPLKASDFIIGYALPLLPIAVAQTIICFALALVLGLKPTGNILLSVLVITPAAVMFTAIGLLAGSLFNDKQVGGVCGALLTNLTGWFSGTFFDLKLVGGTFEKIASCFPFVHAVDAAKAALSGDYSAIFPDLWWVLAYAAVTMTAAVLVFRRKMDADKT